jgi:hypothetical protein
VNFWSLKVLWITASWWEFTSVMMYLLQRWASLLLLLLQVSSDLLVFTLKRLLSYANLSDDP